MSYYISTITHQNFNKTLQQVTKALETEGFGILSNIDVKTTLKEKLNVDFKNYTILGACNPQYAYNALQIEDKIGIMMPCNIIISEQEDGRVEISVLDPTTALNVIENEELQPFANQIKQKLQRCLTYISNQEE